MKYKIVIDSSSNLPASGSGYTTVPLKIVTDQREFADDGTLNLSDMLTYLEDHKGRSGTACPSVGEWLEAFGDAEYVFAIAITSSLSGCYNAAVQAKAVYEEQHPGRKVCALDTLSTGPEMVLIAEKLQELIGAGLSFEEICGQIRSYMPPHSPAVFPGIPEQSCPERPGLSPDRQSGGTAGHPCGGQGQRHRHPAAHAQSAGRGKSNRHPGASHAGNGLPGRQGPHRALPQRSRCQKSVGAAAGGISWLRDPNLRMHRPVQLLCGTGRYSGGL